MLLRKEKNPHTQLTEYNSQCLTLLRWWHGKACTTDTVHFFNTVYPLRLNVERCFGKHVYYPRQHAFVFQICVLCLDRPALLRSGLGDFGVFRTDIRWYAPVSESVCVFNVSGTHLYPALWGCLLGVCVCGVRSILAYCSIISVILLKTSLSILLYFNLNSYLIIIHILILWQTSM